MSPDDLLKMLTEFLSNSGLKSKAPESNNPDRYPRAIKIDPSAEKDSRRKEEVERLQMFIAELEHHRRELMELSDQGSIRMHEMSSVRIKLFSLARKLYPGVALQDGLEDGLGYRFWRTEPWLVAWDSEEGKKDRDKESDNLQKNNDEDRRTGGYI